MLREVVLMALGDNTNAFFLFFLGCLLESNQLGLSQTVNNFFLGPNLH
jgi:hypothetical protein